MDQCVKETAFQRSLIALSKALESAAAQQPGTASRLQEDSQCTRILRPRTDGGFERA
jgi:hypothetical protein